jgi:hypothetical protein
VITTGSRVSRARSNSLKPNPGMSDEGIKLGALTSVALEIEAVLKQSNSQIHLPESLMEVVASILAKMRIGKPVKPTP